MPVAVYSMTSLRKVFWGKKLQRALQFQKVHFTYSLKKLYLLEASTEKTELSRICLKLSSLTSVL